MALQDNDFDQLDHVLTGFECPHEASEAHGALCGVLGKQGKSGKAKWIAWLLQDADTSASGAKEGIVFLDQFYDRANDVLFDESCEFSLLLPDDETRLTARIDALASWCDGFVFGLGFGGVLKSIEDDEEVKEMVDDLIQISKAQGDGADGEASENDFSEIVEYVRVAVLNLLEIANACEEVEQSSVH